MMDKQTMRDIKKRSTSCQIPKTLGVNSDTHTGTKYWQVGVVESVGKRHRIKGSYVSSIKQIRISQVFTRKPPEDCGVNHDLGVTLGTAFIQVDVYTF